jgi:hypothetical protein
MAPVCHAAWRHIPQNGNIHIHLYEHLKPLYVHYISSSLYEITQPCQSINNKSTIFIHASAEHMFSWIDSDNIPNPESG